MFLIHTMSLEDVYTAYVETDPKMRVDNGSASMHI